MMELFLFYFLRDRSLEASIIFQALERKYPDWYEQELTCVPEEIVIQLLREQGTPLGVWGG